MHLSYSTYNKERIRMIPRSRNRCWITSAITTIVFFYCGWTCCCQGAYSWIIQQPATWLQPVIELRNSVHNPAIGRNRRQITNLLLQMSSSAASDKDSANINSESNNSSNKNNNTNDDDDDSDIYVMVNGMPGPMATAAAEACLRKGLQLSPMAMTGPNVESSTVTVVDPITQRHTDVRLISSTNSDELTSSLAGIRTAVGTDNLYAIDYTHPSAVNDNGKFYVRHNIPFVMGTTGGNREELLNDVQNGNIYCVIAPNMGKQIVAMQAALSDLATKYPGAFSGYTLQVTESHQKTKADTSGTAKAVVDSIKFLTADASYAYDDIQMIRNDSESIDFGVPADAIQGHAFHTYTLTSPDNSVQFQLQHNVAGRTVYADGTADAVKFLATKVRQQQQQQIRTNNDTTKEERRVFNMIDVLKEGALE